MSLTVPAPSNMSVSCGAPLIMVGSLVDHIEYGLTTLCIRSAHLTHNRLR